MPEGGILRPTGAQPDEVLTQHHQLFSLPNGWTTLRRYLERNGPEITGEQRVDLIHTLASLVAELHSQGVTHRDLGSDCVWLGAPTNMSLTGFACAQLPDEQSVSDWLDVLGTYAQPDRPTDPIPTACERDVRSLGLMIKEIAQAKCDVAALPEGWQEVADRATAPVGQRFATAVELADALGELRDPSGPAVDQSRLDSFQTTSIPYVGWPAATPVESNGRAARYESIGSDGSRSVVKVWNGVLRGDAQRDHSMLSMLEAASSLAAVPIEGVAPVRAFGLSTVGPFIVTGFAEGETLERLGPISATETLEVLGSLFGAVAALHSRGLAHGDLHPGNVVIDHDGWKATLIDVLDMPLLGTPPVRSTRFVPPNHERLSDEQIDRFAVCRMALALVDANEDLASVRQALDVELARETVETLGPITDVVRLTTRKLTGPAVQEFVLKLPSVRKTTIEPDGGKLWVRRFESAEGIESFFVTGVGHGVVLRLRNGAADGGEVFPMTLQALAQGTPVEMRLSVLDGKMTGVAELTSFLRDRVEALPATTLATPTATNLELEDLGSVEQSDEDEEEERKLESGLDIPRMWLRSAELEDDSVLTVTLGRRVADAGGSAIFRYTCARPLEFEDDDTVEVRIGPGLQGWRVGFLDLPRCDDEELAIRDPSSRLAEGGTVALVDRRDRISKERRRRAVDRITSGRGVIPNLIEFFDPHAVLPTQDYNIAVSEEQLHVYGLNSGQLAAFRQLLQHGPVGLLQGPPGSGKTKFIAAFIHWLLGFGNARRILVASQSHEAVNNALGNTAGRSNVLRVGTRGATERVRPYQARSLRERYRLRFENGLKARVAAAAGTAGVPRDFAYDAVEVHRRLGAPARLLELAEQATKIEDATQLEQHRTAARLRSLSRDFAREAEQVLGRPVDLETEGAAALVEHAYNALLRRHPRTSPGDLATVRKILALAHDWIDTLRSGHRNFDEFLAKTRSVVAGTCVGLGQSQIRLDAGAFDWVIVDEAARCTHGELAVPLQVGSRIVLVGDQRQLRPMVDREVMAGLREELPDVPRQQIERSDFENAFLSSYGKRVAKVLDEQYRMTPVICEVVSRVFYETHGVKLRPSEDRIPDEAFTDLAGILRHHIVWFDTRRYPSEVNR